MTENIENIATLIRKERIRQGLTQEELGQRIGVGKAQVSKIESGNGLTIKTVSRVMNSLNVNTLVRLTDKQPVNRNMVGYIVAAISEFAKTYHLSIREASNYLNRYKGIHFLNSNYEAEHLLSLDDAVEDLTLICLKNGGGIQ